MDEELLARMRCPYCNGDFRVATRLRGDGDRIGYGLIECRCFRFPIVDGVLLLSMSKGYGGAEEDLQPYAPLQVAAITFLERGDVDGLLAWIRRHAPLVARIIEPGHETYLEWAALLHDATDRASEKFLAAQHRFEVVGAAGDSGRRARPLVSSLRRRRRRRRDGADTDALVDQLHDFYVSRFIGPRVNSLALMLASLRRPRTVLSLCCGHGILENLVAAGGGEAEVVSVDAQLLNLLMTRRFANPEGSFICHDVQFPLPFRDGAFDAVASSTCLPEIPAQASFVREAIRVASIDGWSLFDSVWNTELGVHRVDPTRHYRFCQNFFAALDDYVPFFDECAGSEYDVGLDVPSAPAAYATGATWSFGATREALLDARVEHELNFLVVGRECRPMVDPVMPWLTPKRLAVSPAFSVRREDQRLHLERRPPFDDLLPHFAPASFSGYARSAVVDLAALDGSRLLQHFVAGELTLLPPRFGDGHDALALL